MKLDILTSIYSRYKEILFPLLVGVAAVLIGYFVIYPQIGIYFRDTDEIARTKNRVERLSAKVRDLENLDTTITAGKLNTAINALPADRDLSNLIGMVQSIASNNGIVLISVAVGQVSGDSKAKYNPFTIRLETGSGKDAYKTFLNKLEKAPRVMRVSSLELSPARASDSASAITSVEVFFAPTPKEIGAPDAPLPTISTKDEEVLANLEKEVIVLPSTDTGAPIVDVPKGKTNPFQ